MLLRLKMFRLLLKITIYLLPYLAFEIGWPVWAFFVKALGHSVKYPYQGHFHSYYSAPLFGPSWQNIIR